MTLTTVGYGTMCPMTPSGKLLEAIVVLVSRCLLYTSDAADDLLCVDLGGRRNIKKKRKQKNNNTNTHDDSQNYDAHTRI